MRFTEFDLNEQILEAISYMGFEEATPIQQKAIPEILKKRDLIACAQTGTGKTAAFVLPVLHDLAENPTSNLHTLIIVPTRELAIQIDQQIQGLSYFLGVNSLAIYGGGDGSEWDTQKNALSDGTNIVVATPGKLISHLNLGNGDLSKVRHFVLDEADRMLDMNFYDDICRVKKFLTGLEHISMFSATMSPKIRKLAQEILKDPVEISLAVSKPAERVQQSCYAVHESQKAPLVLELIAQRPDFSKILIFSSTKRKVNTIVQALQKGGFSVEGISSDLEQKEREEVLHRFRSEKTRVLVATDVLSRGIDIKDIQLIINFDVPNEAEDYVHRIGRTARAQGHGEAITLVTPDDYRKLLRIERMIDGEVPKGELPAALGTSPELKDMGPGDRRPGNGHHRNNGGNRKSFQGNKRRKGKPRSDQASGNKNRPTS
ncbi:MAG: DEAD/DEAH box helicase [Flavobacteriales bacterium]|nr:DEAD/DEAH box helicase [Flavobacteriales bacterium]MCB9449505.1 DEAD/DEAH box helicase [Flavobacteriales bacterium]